MLVAVAVFDNVPEAAEADGGVHRVGDRAADGHVDVGVVDAPGAAGREATGAARCRGRVRGAGERAGQRVDDRGAGRVAGAGDW